MNRQNDADGFNEEGCPDAKSSPSQQAVGGEGGGGYVRSGHGGGGGGGVCEERP